MRCPWRSAAALGGAMLGMSLSSCSYLADRGLDFLDQFRVTAGLGSSAGVRVRGGGLMETGLMIGIKPRAAALGWMYGTPMYFEGEGQIDAEQAEVVLTSSIYGHDFSQGSYDSARTGLFVLPAVFSWVDSSPESYEWLVPEEGDRFDDRHWLWSAAGFADNRYQQVHAFDVESEVALLVHFGVGYSIGEWVDFLLGWFTIDIAQDDGRFGG